MTCWMAPAPFPSWQPLPAVITEQVTLTVLVAAQPAAGSPSDTVSVSVAMPAVVHVKRVDAAEASSTVPELALQWYVSDEGPLSASWAVADSATDPPTST